MRHIIGFILGTGLALSALALPAGAAADSGPMIGPDGPVVVELFTSQGCSSCPAADAVLKQLAGRKDVIALALHVDYWDYIGWKDTFAQARFTARQKGYARAAGKRMIYTPQMVIEGQEHVVGNKLRDVERLIASHRKDNSGITLSVTRKGGKIRIVASARRPGPQPLWVELVRLRGRVMVDITHGENAGRKIEYSNIVTDWQKIGPWDSGKPLDLTRALKGAGPVAVIIQSPDFGPVLAAAWAR